jgi:hypothetical protein
MTVSSTLRLRSALSLLALLALLGAGSAHGQIVVNRATLSLAEESLVLEANATIEFSPVLEDVVSRGVPLYFVEEFELTRPRWYWFDEKVAAKTLVYRLSYHALTRQYRLSTGALHQSFGSLAEAIGVMSNVRGWPVLERAALAPGETYQAAFRIRLDLTRLPKPIQVSAIGSRDWAFASDWLRWSFQAPEAR